MSGGGKDILIKTVAQALPSYAMSTFFLSQQTCKELEGIMSKFWWKMYKKKDKGISWVNCAREKLKVGWDFVSFIILMMPFYASKLGDLSQIRRIWLARCSKHGIFLIPRL